MNDNQYAREFGKRILNAKNNFEVLGITENSTDDQVKQSRNDLLRLFHPDHYDANLSKQISQRINDAYNSLKDAPSRKIYFVSLNQPIATTRSDWAPTTRNDSEDFVTAPAQQPQTVPQKKPASSKSERLKSALSALGQGLSQLDQSNAKSNNNKPIIKFSSPTSLAFGKEQTSPAVPSQNKNEVSEVTKKKSPIHVPSHEFLFGEEHHNPKILQPPAPTLFSEEFFWGTKSSKKKDKS